MNNQVDAQYIQDEESESLKNVDLSSVSRIKKRQGYHRAVAPRSSTGPTALAAGKYTRNILDFAPDNGRSRYIYSIHDEGIYRVQSILPASGITPSDWDEATGATITVTGTVGSDANTSSDTFAIQADNKLFWFNKGDTAPRMADSLGAVTICDTGTTEPPVGTCAEYMNDRLFIAGVDGDPNIVYYSASGDVTTFETTLNAIKFDVGRDGNIVAMKKRRGNEMMVFLNNAVEALQEDFTYSNTGIDNWYRTVLEPTIGCGARDSVVMYGDEMIFIDDQGLVRLLGRSVNDKQKGVFGAPLSEKIQETFPGNINKAHMNKAQSVIFDNKLFIAAPSSTSTENDFVAVYDFRYRTWTGIWETLAVRKWLVSDIATDGVEELYFSSDGGEFFHLLDGKFQDKRANNSAEAAEYGAEVPIELEIKTKAYDFQAPSSEKIWHWLEIEADGTAGSTLDVYVSIDGEPEESVGSVSLVGGVQPALDDASATTGPPQLPIQLVSLPKIRKKFHMEAHPRGISAQLILRNTDANTSAILVGHRFGALVENVDLELES